MYRRESIFGLIRLPQSQNNYITIIFNWKYVANFFLSYWVDSYMGWNVHGIMSLRLNVTKLGWPKLQWAKWYGRQLIPVFMGPNERFGVEEELVHFGVHLSQGLDVFLDPVSTKRAGQNVGRTKGTWTTKRQGTTLGMYLTCTYTAAEFAWIPLKSWTLPNPTG